MFACTTHANVFPFETRLIFPIPCMWYSATRGDYAAISGHCALVTDQPLCHAAMNDAAANLLSLEDRLADVRKQLRAKQRASRNRSSIPPMMWEVACIIFTLTHPHPEPVHEYFRQRHKQWEEVLPSVTPKLTHWYNSTTPEVRDKLTHQPVTRKEKQNLRRAEEFLLDRRLHNWVEDMNLHKGIAPMSSVVLRQKRGFAAERPATCNRLVCGKRKSQLQWLRRWRARWGISLGRVSPRDTLPIDACQRKAGHLKTHA